MLNINTEKIEGLRIMIFNLLISDPEVGLGEVPECREAANELVNDWLTSFHINEVK